MSRCLALAVALAAALTGGCSRKPAVDDSRLVKARSIVETRCNLRWNLLRQNPAAMASKPPDMPAWSAERIATMCRCRADGAAARISLDDLEFYVKETDFRQAAQRTMLEIEKTCDEQAAPN